MKANLLTDMISDILRNIPNRPFLCLLMSAIMYAILKDNDNIQSNFISGSLSFKDEIIFKQDFSIAKAAIKKCAGCRFCSLLVDWMRLYI